MSPLGSLAGLACRCTVGEKLAQYGSNFGNAAPIRGLPYIGFPVAITRAEGAHILQRHVVLCSNMDRYDGIRG